MKRIFGMMIILLICRAASAQSPAGNEALRVKVVTLPNGLTVLLNEDHTKSEVFGAVAVKAGSKYDPADATGLAHYLEHMCFKGTEDMGTLNYAAEKPILDSITMLYDKLGQTKDEKQRADIQKQINDVSVRAAQYAIPNDMDRLIKSIGGKELNAFTSFEMVVYHNSFPSHQLNKWLDLYSHRFEKPVFRLFQPELEVVYEEKNRGSDNFFGPLFESYLKNLFKVHPYGTQSTIGTTDHLKNPPLRRMQEYYNTYFVANNMALILTGDFNIDDIMPVITEKFGKWRSGNVPVFPKYEEKPFNGRELVQKRMSPIKLDIMGYRTPKATDQELYPLEVANFILNNKGETGLLDELRLNGKIQAAQIFNFPLNDYGATSILVVPKILGQSTDNAEKLVRDELDSLKAGKYSPTLMQAAKNNLKLDFYKGMEDHRQRALAMVQCFISGRSWDDYLQYPAKIDAITAADVERVAKKYYGDNFLAYHSKMGFPKKDKLKKPGFKPVTPKEGVKSEYARKFEAMPSAAPKPHFVNLNTDVTEYTLAASSKLYVTPNPLNNIFEARLKYKIDEVKLPMLDASAGYFNMVGTESMSPKVLKQKMSMLGCTYQFATEDNGGLTVTISGLEDNASEAIRLVNELMLHPKADAMKYKMYLSDEKTNRKLAAGDPSSAVSLMQNYLIYGRQSKYLSATSMDVLKKTDPAAVLNVMKTAMNYPLSIYYSGLKPAGEVKDMFTASSFSVVPGTASLAPVPGGNAGTRQHQKLAEPTIYVLYRKDARQTQMYYYSDEGAFKKENIPAAQAFNSYFGGDMSSLVFQEIREFRSLAYTAYMAYATGQDADDNNYLTGYVGCQGDKTKDAIIAMNELIRNMPVKADRMNDIRTGMIDVAYTARPDFRDLGEKVELWKERGYTTDPAAYNLQFYDLITFTDIVNFYNTQIKNAPISMAIVGTKDNIPLDELKKLGKVVIVKEKDILVK